MAEIDGLDIAPGRNQGEAVILPETTFDPVEFSRQALALQGAKQVAKKKKEIEDRKKWDEIKDPMAKWDIDHQNLFLPQIEKNRTEIRELMARTNGRPTDAEYAAVQNKNNDLTQQVTLSDEQKKTFDGLMAKVQTEKGSGTESGQSAYDHESEARVRAWGNPWESKEVKLQNGKTVGEELKRLGATQFRAQYQGELTKLEPRWDLADKTLGWSKKLEDNKPRNGNVGSIKGLFRGHTDEQIESARIALQNESKEKFGNSNRFEEELDDFFNKNMSEKDQEALANNAMKEAGILNAKGEVDPAFKADIRKRVNEQMPEASEAEKQVAEDMMQKQIIDNAIDKKKYNAYFRQKVEAKFTPYEKQSINISNGGGGAPKNPIVAVTNKPLSVGTWSRKTNGAFGVNQRQVNAPMSLQMNLKSRVGNVPSTNAKNMVTGEAISTNDITRGDVTEINVVPIFTAKAKNTFGDRVQSTIASEDQIAQLGGWEKAVADGVIEYNPMAFGTMKRITYKDDKGKQVTQTGDEAAINQIISALGSNNQAKVEDENFYLPLNEVESGLVNSQSGEDRNGYVNEFNKMKKLSSDRNSKKKKGKYSK